MAKGYCGPPEPRYSLNIRSSGSHSVFDPLASVLGLSFAIRQKVTRKARRRLIGLHLVAMLDNKSANSLTCLEPRVGEPCTTAKVRWASTYENSHDLLTEAKRLVK